MTTENKTSSKPENAEQPAGKGLDDATCSLLGFRWSIAIDTQAPFACYIDRVRDDCSDDETWVRYRTLDDQYTGWREAKTLRPLVTEQDWHDLKAAIHHHKVEMARKFLSENAQD